MSTSQGRESRAPALEIRDLSKSFGSVRALQDVTVVVESGTVHCVLGENGAGKSTLCHLVGGSLAPDAGTLRLYGQPYAPRRPADALGAGIAMVHQHFSLVPTLTVGENLRLLRLPGLGRRLDRVADEYGLVLDPGARVAELPVGLRQRVEIVKALLREPRLLLLDEPTGVLDPAGTEALLATCRRIADRGGAVVLITHKLGEVGRAGDAATVLRGGRVVGGGPLADLPPEKLVPLMIGRTADSLDPALSSTTGLAGPATPATAAASATPQGPPALRIDGLTVRGADGVPALDDVRLEVEPGQIVGIAGVEGNGQSELMAVLGGSRAPGSGSLTLGAADITRATPRRRTAAGLGVVPEDRHHDGCVPDLSVTDNLFLGKLGRFRRGGLFLDRPAMRRAAQDVLSAHDIRADGPDTPMSTLSGGNQQKVVLARELALDPLVCLAAAQPTRGLDVGAVAAVHTRIREAAARGAGVLVVSSELDELLALCDRVVVAYRGRLSAPVATSAPAARERIGHLMLGAEAAAPPTAADLVTPEPVPTKPVPKEAVPKGAVPKGPVPAPAAHTTPGTPPHNPATTPPLP
ncbi:sugar ABC transporter [Streptomyces dioscori]|uniref:Sugar ABC transporter n=1 Tax=Streptomyces dioscori TaxID=2109333 RepID=A0A2P8QEI9_9ACTN|nr:ABC transporter ATP-binding protein [Streptomyces dioscori]PSM44670.1 sugar ABC transporter [Streptomyces dioscori]